MKILVTGARGQLAQSLGERAQRRPDVELLLMGRPQLDLDKPGSATAAIIAAAPDVVINAAAYTAVDQAEDEPQRALLVNAEGAGEVATAAAKVDAAVVQISTDYVFDGRGGEAYDEEARPNPLSVYGRSKLEGERRARANNPRHVIVRTSWVYSPFGRNFLKSIMAAAGTRDRLTVVDDQCGSPSYALDLADALLTMLEKSPQWGETYHLAGSDSTSWCGFAREIMAQCSRLGLPYAEVQPIRTEDWPTRATRPRNSILDCHKFERNFGFVMPDWRGSVRAAVERLASSR